MDDQAKEDFFEMIEQEIEKANTVKAAYCSIEEALLFLQDQNKIRYSRSDLQNLVYSGDLAPYFYYKGVLIRVDRLGENLMNEYRGLAAFDGFVTPFNKTSIQAMQYASSEVKVSFRDVLISKDFIALELHADSYAGIYGSPLKDSFSRTHADVSFYTIPDEADKQNLKNHPIFRSNEDEQLSTRIEDCFFHKDDLARIKKTDQEKFEREQLIESQILELKKENIALKQQLDDLRQSQNFMVCCDSKYEYYAPELHHVLKMWNYIYVENVRKARHSHTQDVENWINQNIV